MDQKIQPREILSVDALDDYLEVYQGCDGDKVCPFPPLRVFWDGETYWLSRGFHRITAAMNALWASHPCEIVNGTWQDAVLDAISDNGTHGVRRNAADKRKSVMTLLNNKNAWSEWSDRIIAAKACVSHTFVAQVREDSLPKVPRGNVATCDSGQSESDESPAQVSGADGKRYRSKAVRKAAPEVDPEAEEKGPEERMRNVNSDIESACRDLMKLWNEIVLPLEKKTAWLSYRNHIGGATAKVKSAVEFLRSCKGKALCKKCKGDGCRSCRQMGWVTRAIWEQTK